MLVIIGFMGAGKSVVGRALAARLRSRWSDSDSQFLARHGHSPGAHITTYSEAHFRELERHIVVGTLRTGAPAEVYSLGGGAVTTPATRQALRHGRHHVVYLQTNLETIMGRPHIWHDRPLLQRRDLPDFFAERCALYESIADDLVDVTARNTQTVVAKIALGLPTHVLREGVDDGIGQ